MSTLWVSAALYCPGFVSHLWPEPWCPTRLSQGTLFWKIRLIHSKCFSFRQAFPTFVSSVCQACGLKKPTLWVWSSSCGMVENSFGWWGSQSRPELSKCGLHKAPSPPLPSVLPAGGFKDRVWLGGGGVLGGTGRVLLWGKLHYTWLHFQEAPHFNQTVWHGVSESPLLIMHHVLQTQFVIYAAHFRGLLCLRHHTSH